MRSVIWIVACVVLLGCESRRLQTVESSRDVTQELATAVRRALDAKRVEEDRLVQYGVEKQRLISALMPLDVHWADLHPLAVEDYVSERDPEAAKNLCVVLGLEFMAAELGQSVAHRSRELQLVLDPEFL
jgi:hypothetical protein